MNKRLITLLLATGIAVIFVATGLQAGTAAPDTMKIETQGFKKHTKPPVDFTHKKHIEDYKIACGECHHDDKGKALANLKMGDDVKKCSECHNKFEKDKKNKKDIMVLENAMHGNCIECHKEANIKAGDPKGRKGPAPTTCNACHKKDK